VPDDDGDLLMSMIPDEVVVVEDEVVQTSHLQRREAPALLTVPQSIGVNNSRLTAKDCGHARLYKDLEHPSLLLLILYLELPSPSHTNSFVF